MDNVDDGVLRMRVGSSIIRSRLGMGDVGVLRLRFLSALNDGNCVRAPRKASRLGRDRRGEKQEDGEVDKQARKGGRVHP
jgi:hypothetical protein